jgi:hypothetical protein
MAAGRMKGVFRGRKVRFEEEGCPFYYTSRKTGQKTAGKRPSNADLRQCVKKWAAKGKIAEKGLVNAHPGLVYVNVQKNGQGNSSGGI